ncbi:hypothetical protein [Roseiconus lacunae]|uniref:hypothetical protein n=1 Tax=Roseiconus lacunae TaxID=2605694 RepID=UPI001E332B7E|nr:hypothetical protein [Roseiconus lacunae]MCD0460141.1 hypothetical protein [Roseiconus lacunae]
MNDKPDIAERIGAAINELDIDFSRFTLAGWFISLLSLLGGGSAAYAISSFMIRRNGLDVAAGLVFCLTMIAVTTVGFLVLRWAFAIFGVSITKST